MLKWSAVNVRAIKLVHKQYEVQTVSVLKPHKQPFQTFVQRLMTFTNTRASIKVSATVSSVYLFPGYLFLQQNVYDTFII
jgi:hypothetical protein